jgi:hypothetical protein
MLRSKQNVTWLVFYLSRGGHSLRGFQPCHQVSLWDPSPACIVLLESNTPHVHTITSNHLHNPPFNRLPQPFKKLTDSHFWKLSVFFISKIKERKILCNGYLPWCGHKKFNEGLCYKPMPSASQGGPQCWGALPMPQAEKKDHWGEKLH